MQSLFIFIKPLNVNDKNENTAAMSGFFLFRTVKTLNNRCNNLEIFLNLKNLTVSVGLKGKIFCC